MVEESRLLELGHDPAHRLVHAFNHGIGRVGLLRPEGLAFACLPGEPGLALDRAHGVERDVEEEGTLLDELDVVVGELREHVAQIHSARAHQVHLRQRQEHAADVSPFVDAEPELEALVLRGFRAIAKAPAPEKATKASRMRFAIETAVDTGRRAPSLENLLRKGVRSAAGRG